MVKYKKEHINRVFHALADPTRRKILEMVAQKERTASELAKTFEMSFPAVSKHLKVLEGAAFIRREVTGRVHRFTFEKKTMKSAYDWMRMYEKFWLDNLENLGDFLDQKKER